MLRRLPALAAIIATAALLAGCAPGTAPGGGGPDPLTQVEVTGDVGTAPTVVIGDLSGLGAEPVRAVLVEGDGLLVDDATVIDPRMAVFDGGTKQEEVAYAPVGQLFTPGDAQLPAFFTDVFAGVPSGSRVVAIVPGAVLAAQSGGAPGATTPAPAVIVADVYAVPTQAWGAPQPATQQLVSVADGADGSPQISIEPGAQAPGELVLDVRKLGDGPVVEAGQNVTVQYRGVLFATGEEFDSSWSRGTPTQFTTDQVVPGFASALVGRPVGSQVVAIIPPELAYGDQATGSIPPGSTLVFVVDILAAA